MPKRYYTANGEHVLLQSSHNDKKWFSWLFPKSSKNKFTLYITIIDIIIYLICLAYQTLAKTSYYCVLYNLGAAYTPAITVYFQWQRILFPIFLHSGLLHLMINMLTQLNIGFYLEDYIGTKKFILLYFGAGIGANLISCAIKPMTLSVGASGALFGIVALKIIYFNDNWDKMTSRRNYYVRNFIFMLLINFVGVRHGKINTTAHIGGFCVGFLISILYAKKALISKLKLRYMKNIAMVLLAIIYTGTIVYIFSLTKMRASAAKMEAKC